MNAQKNQKPKSARKKGSRNAGWFFDWLKINLRTQQNARTRKFDCTFLSIKIDFFIVSTIFIAASICNKKCHPLRGVDRLSGPTTVATF